MGIIHEDLCTLMILSPRVFHGMRNVKDKAFSKNCAVYEIVWKNMAQLDMPQMTMLFCGNSGYANTHQCDIIRMLTAI